MVKAKLIFTKVGTGRKELHQRDNPGKFVKGPPGNDVPSGDTNNLYGKLRSKRGDMLVEFVIIFPILFALIWFMLAYGMALYSKNTMNIAAREAARISAHAETSGDSEEKAKTEAITVAARIIANNMHINEEDAKNLIVIDTKYVHNGETYCRAVSSYVLPIPVYGLGNFKLEKHNIVVSSEAISKKEFIELEDDN